MPTKKGQLKADPSGAPVKRKRTPRRAQQITLAAVDADVAHCEQVLQARREAWRDGYKAAGLKAIKPKPLGTLVERVVVVGYFMYVASLTTVMYLDVTDQLVSLRTCRPVVLMDLDSQRRRLEEQIESLQPRGYASLEAR